MDGIAKARILVGSGPYAVAPTGVDPADDIPILNDEVGTAVTHELFFDTLLLD